ncbi:hypothetical protein FS837_004415 [Tulasnella sp. UAMH 9824]|nr:hypothetical protein FS837_004415 [Tulasnella sp. UAMH 9824]
MPPTTQPGYLSWRIFAADVNRYQITGPVIPFEIWRFIFLDLFADLDVVRRSAMEAARNARRVAPVLSNLNARYLVFQGLWVCKYWYAIARDVFFENIEAETAQSLLGLRKAFGDNRHLAEAVLKITMSFPTFRDTESDPRRPLKVQVPDGLPPEDPATVALTRQVAVAEAKRLRYRPSDTQQRVHWQRWQALCSEILHRCTGLQEIDIVFTLDYTTQNLARNSRDYRSLWGKPDLGNQGIMNGLLACKNLRRLDFVDPSPLEEYGPGLQGWEKLKSASITLSSNFTEISKLPTTAFCPPRDLESLRILDHSAGMYHWPLESDIARCKDLKVLHLGLVSMQQRETTLAVGFLLFSYQSSLIELTLSRMPSIHSRRQEHAFAPIFESFSNVAPWQPLVFPRLQKLDLDSAEPISIFTSFSAHELRDLRVHLLTRDHSPSALAAASFGATAANSDVKTEYWKAKLSVPSLGRLKSLRLSVVDPFEQPAIAAACEALGVSFEVERETGRRNFVPPGFNPQVDEWDGM